MLKYILFIAGNLLLANTALCHQVDTTIVYLKYDPTEFRGFRKVATLDSADFIRMILPPDAGESLINIKEFYKNGNPKLTQKCDPDFNPAGIITPNGDRITYFSNGKRQSIAHYTSGQKDGDEILFYPNGAIYCLKKNPIDGASYSTQSKNWECYDKKGTMICSEGNGQWIVYDYDFNALTQGKVKNGLFEGDWHGQTTTIDSTKFVYKFNKGVYVSGVGYDKAGTAYPFVNDVEAPAYKKGNFAFVRLVRSNLKMPRDSAGRKISIKFALDTAHISFIIEKDGTLTNGEFVGNTIPELTIALRAALAKCGAWYTRTYYGIPMRTQIIIPYRDLRVSDANGNVYMREIKWQEHIIGF